MQKIIIVRSMALQKADYRDVFLEFIESNEKYRKQIGIMITSRKKSLEVNFIDIFSHNDQLADLIANSPKEILPKLESSLYEYITTLDPTYQSDVKKVHVRIKNFPNTIELRKLRTEYLHKLVSVEGIVTKITPVKQRLKRATLLHLRPDCMQEFVWPQNEDEEFDEFLEIPSTCPVCGKTGQFKIIEEKSEFMDWQKAAIQERPEEMPPGQTPRQLEIILEDDLVDNIKPGDRVILTGILETKKEMPAKRGAKSVFDFILRVNSVEVLQKTLDEIQISESEQAEIQKLAQDPWIVERIIASIAPEIYGHWEIKEGVAVALFGGVPKTTFSGLRIRGDIHVLIIGDPGTAKSQLLHFVAKVAPRAIMANGKGSTSAGLTAAVTRDSFTGDYYIEAGALVLADGGIAIIDEIDKMRSEDRVAIHEALEQQTVTVHKASIHAILNARATVIAAGNPKFGRYFEDRPVSDNINLPPTLLSRFDLIFVLIDKPNEEDQLLASHILDVHAGNLKAKNVIPPELLKKYIAYARKYVFPKLSEEAKNVLQDFFIEMRKKYSEKADTVPITARQLEALIRISEAYARMRLSNVITKEDAERAVNLVRIMLEKVGIDIETGSVDIDSIMTGKPRSARDKMITILEIIDTLAGKSGCAKLKDIINEAERAEIEKSQAEKIISQMMKEGLIYEHKTDCYRKA